MQKPLRLGVSTSCFLYLMPIEILQRVYLSSRTGTPHKLDERLNAMMAEYTGNIMQVINSMPIDSMECYHSTVWAGAPLADVMLDKPSVEFWSAHASYGRWIDPSSPVDEVRIAARGAYCESVDLASKIGAKTVVAHAGTHVIANVSKQTRMEHTVGTLTAVADHAAELGIRLAIEPLPKDEPGNTLDEVLWIVRQIDRRNVGINFDVNHVFPASDVPNLIKRAGELIFSVHISDQDDQERHWLPFAGKLDWKAVLASLIDAGYQGPLIYETHIKDVHSYEQIGEMIVENYSRLIELAP